jgi:predicted RNA-binding Zn-ribbon protein involved in translation (DUF1610 family)
VSYVYTDIAIFKCPGCKDKVRIDGVQPFYKRLRKPQPFDCPACGCAVIWAKKPIQVFQVGQWLLAAGFVPIFINGYAFWSIPTFAGASLVMVVGMMTQRLVVHEPDPSSAGREAEAQR